MRRCRRLRIWKKFVRNFENFMTIFECSFFLFNVFLIFSTNQMQNKPFLGELCTPIFVFPRFSLKYFRAFFHLTTSSHAVLWWLVSPRLFTSYTFPRVALSAFSRALDRLQFPPVYYSCTFAPVTRSRAYTFVDMISLQDLIGILHPLLVISCQSFLWF